MADYKTILTTTPDAASNTTNSSAFVVPGEASDFALQIPAASGWCITASVSIRIMGASSETGTYYRVGYTTDPSVVVFTSTTSAFVLAETAASAGVSGGVVVMDGFRYVKYCKLEFSRTATAAANFVLMGRFNKGG